ncbi:MAG: UDP-N-acetylglucosamine 2-epimerase (non-hydrolyzing) [Balneolaceae bacterium]|nr:UDP-N-acetylglucosamine 2-epimerase (non-hydrolyzing) [Balneolaceae bacterium]
MKIISVVGARPQFIKLGPLSREIRKNHEEIIIHTGQHYDHEMSDLFFEQLEIPKPDVNLEIGSGYHGAQTGKMLEGIENEILKHKPDLVLSFGDTNSTLAACLAAAKLEVPSLHIEAGLRSFNRSMPEEINRVVADHTADLLFAPTEEAVKHLECEGLADKTVMTGDIMADSVQFVQGLIGENRYAGRKYSVLTMHRPYNVDDPEKLKKLFAGLEKLGQAILFPVHPRTRKIVESNQVSVPGNVELIKPQGYIEFHGLIKYAEKVITDSGGLQKEAYIAGKPCITLRPETEWVETVEAGWNMLLDVEDPGLAEKIAGFNPSGKRLNLYGKDVAKRMVDVLEEMLS